MRIQPTQQLSLLDVHHNRLGAIIVSSFRDGLLIGSFERADAFGTSEKLFLEFEAAVELQQLVRVDELDRAIASMGLHLANRDDLTEVAVRDVQIWSDGSFTCRITTAEGCSTSNAATRSQFIANGVSNSSPLSDARGIQST